VYGCVQASTLWYLLIGSMLEGMSYQASETDRYVFRKQVGDHKVLLPLYIENILTIVDKNELKKIKNCLEEKFETNDRL
jgi:hypothetical protein